MGIRFLCPNGHKLNVKEFLAGKRGSCPHCNAKFLVPAASVDGPVAEAHDEPVPSVSPIHSAMITPLDPSASVSKPASAMPFNAQGLPAGVLPAGRAGLSDPLAESGAANWYVRLASGDQFGPAQADHMREWMKEDRIPGDSLVWREGWEEWKRADEIFPKFAPAPAPVPAPMPAPAAAYGAPTYASPAPMPMVGYNPAMQPGPAMQPAPGYHAPQGHAAGPMYGAANPAAAVAMGPGAFVARPVGPTGAPLPMPARPVGPVMAARALGGPAPTGGAPAAAFDVAPVDSEENTGETGEFLRTMAGDAPPEKKSGDSAPMPRRNNNSAAIIVTIIMIFVIAGLSFALVDILKRPPPAVLATTSLGKSGYSIKVPGGATGVPETLSESTAGGSMNSRVNESTPPQQGGLKFYYYISEIPNATAAQEQSERFFAESAQALLKRIPGGGTVAAGLAINRAGATGKQFTISGGDRHGRVQVYLLGKYRLVMAAVGPSSVELHQPIIDNFFASLSAGSRD